MEARDYANRTYLSAIEAARFLGVSVRMVHRLTTEGLSLASPPTRNRRIYRIETHWPFGGKPAIALNLRGFCELFGESEGVCAICCGWMWVGIGLKGRV